MSGGVCSRAARADASSANATKTLPPEPVIAALPN